MSPPRRELVLIVDDNKTTVLLTKNLLERAGYRAYAVRSGNDLDEYLRTSQPDLILMDIQLPDYDGLTLTRALKSDPATAGIPIIVMTSRSLPEDRAAALEAGCDDFMTKPVDIGTFHRTIQTVLQRRREAEVKKGG